MISLGGNFLQLTLIGGIIQNVNDNTALSNQLIISRSNDLKVNCVGKNNSDFRV